MAVFSTHLLDAVSGTHLASVRIDIRRVRGGANGGELLTSARTGADGRLTVELPPGNEDAVYEAVVRLDEAFPAQAGGAARPQTVREAVVRFRPPSLDARVHIPMILAPHGYSTWWSR